MTPNQWSNLRQYIDLTIEINDAVQTAPIGNATAKKYIERLRMRHSELETMLRESCEDPTHDA